jgi:hypothetical protein
MPSTEDVARTGETGGQHPVHIIALDTYEKGSFAVIAVAHSGLTGGELDVSTQRSAM